MSNGLSYFTSVYFYLPHTQIRFTLFQVLASAWMGVLISFPAFVFLGRSTPSLHFDSSKAAVAAVLAAAARSPGYYESCSVELIFKQQIISVIDRKDVREKAWAHAAALSSPH